MRAWAVLWAVPTLAFVLAGAAEAKGHGAEIAGGVSIVVGYGTGYPRHYYDYRRYHHRYSPFYPRSYYYGRHYRRHYYDDRPKKRRAARIIIVDGVTYERIDGQYYRRQGESYRLESPPRAGSYRVLSAKEEPGQGYKPGQTLSRLPEPKRQVRVDGHLYWTHKGVWFASLEQGGFVVIQPPK